MGKGKIFRIKGYWKDTKKEFQSLVYEWDECPANLDDDNIFYFGINEQQIIQAINDIEESEYEFVITRYWFVREIKHIEP